MTPRNLIRRMIVSNKISAQRNIFGVSSFVSQTTSFLPLISVVLGIQAYCFVVTLPIVDPTYSFTVFIQMPPIDSSSQIAAARGFVNLSPYSPLKTPTMVDTNKLHSSSHSSGSLTSGATIPASSVDEEDVVQLAEAPVLSKEEKLQDQIQEIENELENTNARLREAEEDLQEIRTAAEERNTCNICFDIYTNPRSLPCGHVFCGDCIAGHARTRSGKKKNGFCPACRVVFGRFTPIVAHHVKRDVGDMAAKVQNQSPKAFGKRRTKRFKWPSAFKSSPTTLPFPLDKTHKDIGF
ncbi:hypothetical protein C8R42DRAFT_720016 [Lentinula raphanica]|nr:hypothetical protein C8R42DRAFT_720016 [Lentinula raphanica]